MMKRMKIGLVMLTAMLMLSTATLMPVVNAEPVNKIIKQNEIEERFIDKIGEEKYKELENAATKALEEILSGDYLYENFLDLLKEFASVIMQLLLILFGLNPIGVAISIFLTMIIMIIPVLALSVVASVEVTIMNLFENLGIDDLPELLSQLGVFGIILLIFVILPLLIIVSILAIPFTASVFFTVFMTEILECISGVW